MRKIYLWISLALFCVTACAAGDDKQRGADAAISGHYSEAYQLWLPLAERGDREVQESIALLLASGQDVGVKLSQSERDRLTLRWLLKAGRNGQASAMKWLADSFKNGWMGLPKDEAKSQCWAKAAVGDKSIAECDKLSDLVE